jgi:hypothetical protein
MLWPASYLRLVKILLLAVARYIYSILNSRVKPFYQKKIINIKPFILDQRMLENLPEYNIPKNASEISEPKIMLATKLVPLDQNVFCAKYDDNEDLFSANRFYWIFNLILENNSVAILGQIKEMIFKWIEIHDANKDAIVYESYSISERIISWLTFLCISGRILKYEKYELNNLADSIGKQIYYLIRNMEFRGNRTNNHILNNSRVLYFCGLAFRNDQLKKSAQAVLHKYFDRIVINGCVDEGSSHYQHLVTMKFLELLKFASSMKDDRAVQWLEPRIRMMLEHCRMIQSKYYAVECPLFGDISPDMPPYWTTGWPFSVKIDNESPWFKMFNFIPENNYLSGNVRSNYIFKLSDENDGFETWISMKSNGIRCHGHNDNGSMVIFYKGRPIIVDPGLNTYLLKDDARVQVSQRSHNFPLVGNAMWDPEKTSLISESQMRSSIKKRPAKNGIVYELTSFDSAAIVIRSIETGGSSVVIKDKVKKNKLSNKIHRTILAVSPDINPRLSGGEVVLEDMGLKIISNAEIKMGTMVCSKKYGDRKLIKNIIFENGNEEEVVINVRKI